MLIELESKEVDLLLEAVYKRYGYDFSGYSRASIKRRIQRIIEKLKLRSLYELKYQLINDESVFVDFLQNITVNVTEMFRDPHFYKSLTKNVFPQLATYPFIKIWHAGCSTGEEVFSMAILLKEAGLLDRAKLYATDINPLALNKAKQGIFPLRNIKEYTQNYRQAGGEHDFSDYYTAKYDNAIFDQSLKKNMVFSLHNLVSDQSFNEFNLIICRNVLIYFEKNLQDRVIKLFTNSLVILGYLGLGSKESLLFTEVRNHYQSVDLAEKIYKRIK
jgi:chemotaxis protein methyltransferase CheR